MIYRQDHISIEYFCDEMCEVFKIVEINDNHKHHSVVRKYRGGLIVGLLMTEVVHVDTYNYLSLPSNSVILGGKVKILKRGEVAWSFDKKLRLPYKQPIYANPKTASFSWRALGPQIGYISHFNKDGYCKIQLDFERYS